MRRLSTALFILGIVLLILWVGVPFIADMFDLVLTDQRLSGIYHNTRYFIVPGAFLLTLFVTLRKSTTELAKWRTIFLTVIAASLSVLIFMAGFFDGLCGSSAKQVLFINRQKPSSKVLLREYDCGAASAGYRLEIVRVDTFFGIFIRVRKVDTTKLELDNWVRPPAVE